MDGGHEMDFDLSSVPAAQERSRSLFLLWETSSMGENLVNCLKAVIDQSEGDEIYLAGVQAGSFSEMKRLGFSQDSMEEIWAKARACSCFPRLSDRSQKPSSS